MRASICPLDPGLYVVRYVSSDMQGQPPSAFVKPNGGCENDIDIVMAPGDKAGVLGAPGSNLVLIVRNPSRLEILVDGEEPAETLDARFKVECLALRRPAEMVPALPDRSSPAAGLLVSAHVQRRGDIEASDGGWIAGPEEPAPIEGLSCRCPGTGVGIGIQFMNTLSDRWSSWHAPQSFAGTRQKASPLTALRLRLEGQDADRFDIVAEAMFLNAPALVREGADVLLLGAGMMDPLVGLRVSLKPKQSEHRPAPQRPPEAPRKPSRVRVFRSDGSTALNTSKVA